MCGAVFTSWALAPVWTSTQVWVVTAGGAVAVPANVPANVPDKIPLPLVVEFVGALKGALVGALVGAMLALTYGCARRRGDGFR